MTPGAWVHRSESCKTGCLYSEGPVKKRDHDHCWMSAIQCLQRRDEISQNMKEQRDGR